MHVEVRGQHSEAGFLFVPCFEPLTSASLHTLDQEDASFHSVLLSPRQYTEITGAPNFLCRFWGWGSDCHAHEASAFTPRHFF